MGINIKYSLPPHVSAEMLVQTISRIVGSPLKYEGDGDIHLDSSPTNKWIATPMNNYATYNQSGHQKDVENVRNSREKLASFFNKNTEDLIRANDYGYLKLQIKALDINATDILCAPSGDHFHHQGRGRAIGPNSSLFWAAIFTRITEMFGGKLVYSDAGDFDDPKNYLKVSTTSSLYAPPKKKESEDDIRCRFSNALRKLEPVNDELINFLVKKKNFSNKSGNDDRVESLLRMGVLRFEEDMNLLIPPKEEAPKDRVMKF